MASETHESVTAVLKQCTAEYDAILSSSELASSDVAQSRIAKCLQTFRRLLVAIDTQGAFSKNEDIDDMSTVSLSLITVPFYMATLTARTACDGSNHRLRVEALGASTAHLMKFLGFCEAIRLIREEEIERRVDYHALDRTARIESHRRQRALEEELRELTGKLKLEVARNKRMRRILKEDDPDAAEDEESDEAPEELLRQRHLVHAKLCIEEAIQIIHANTREAEMLGGMTEEEKRAAVDKYQAALLEDRLHQPNLHFPATRRPELADVYLNVTAGTVSGPLQQQPMSGANYSIMGCGHSQPLRQRIKEEAFIDRNRPTMTLEEFAEGEMQAMAEQARRQAEGKREQMEEDARLGAEGVEERERVKAAAWDDWKDDHPANGITSKGNYS